MVNGENRAKVKALAKKLVGGISLNTGMGIGVKTTVKCRESSFRELLARLGVPNGLLTSVLACYSSCYSMVWLIDNSSSMKKRDSRIMGRPIDIGEDSPKIESRDNMTRWHEVRDCVSFHCYMAEKCWIRTKLRLMNVDDDGDYKFSLCCGSPDDVPDEISRLKTALKHATLAQDQCPLSAQIRKISKIISDMTPALNANNQKVTVVIFTQGLPTDKRGTSTRSVQLEFWSELQALSKHPVNLIVRLCTDNEEVRNVYNTFDGRFNSIDVLDDYWGEAMEIHLCNPWLTYGIGLHRLREACLLPSEIFDNIDERPFNLDQLHEFCKLFFIGGDRCIDLPHPRKSSWESFFDALKVLIEKEKTQWNPVKKKTMPWIDLDRLQLIHGGRKKVERRHSSYQSKSKESSSRFHSQENTTSNNRNNEPRRASSQKHYRRPSMEPQGSYEQPTQKSQDYRRDDREGQTKPQTERTPAADLQNFILTAPLKFPPKNTMVEPHEYFQKWTTFDATAFEDVNGDELVELLLRASKKVKFFLHPDKLPNDLTENQTQLFSTLWNELQEKETLINK